MKFDARRDFAPRLALWRAIHFALSAGGPRNPIYKINDEVGRPHIVQRADMGMIQH